MIVDSNAPAPLKYTDPTFSVLLFVQANIYDTSGVSPVLAAQIPLTLINNGTYWGKYTFTAGKTYLVQKLVYTDGSYSTVDTNFGQDNDDVQCINLGTANLDAAVSTRVATTHFDTILGTPVVSVSADIAEIEAETDGIAAIPTNPLLTNDVRLNHLDADISSRLPTSSYTAPDNADIAAIKVQTDKMLFDGSSFIKANTQVEVSDPNIAAIKAQTDQLTFSPDGVNAHVSQVVTTNIIQPITGTVLEDE